MAKAGSSKGKARARSSNNKAKAKGEVEFHYIKSPQFATVHVDGGIGGPTPSGLLHLAVFAERAAIPQSILTEVDEEGRLGKQIRVSGRGGIARELQVDLVMTAETAKRLFAWFAKHIATLEDQAKGKEVKVTDAEVSTGENE